MTSHFNSIPASGSVWWTDGRTEGRTDQVTELPCQYCAMHHRAIGPTDARWKINGSSNLGKNIIKKSLLKFIQWFRQKFVPCLQNCRWKLFILGRTCVWVCRCQRIFVSRLWTWIYFTAICLQCPWIQQKWRKLWRGTACHALPRWRLATWRRQSWTVFWMSNIFEEVCYRFPNSIALRNLSIFLHTSTFLNTNAK